MLSATQAELEGESDRVERVETQSSLSSTAQKKKARADNELANEEKSRRRWERNYSSEDSIIEDESAFAVYYCAFCGAFALVVDVKLDTLPTRKTDGSRVLEVKVCLRLLFSAVFKVRLFAEAHVSAADGGWADEADQARGWRREAVPPQLQGVRSVLGVSTCAARPGDQIL